LTQELAYGNIIISTEQEKIMSTVYFQNAQGNFEIDVYHDWVDEVTGVEDVNILSLSEDAQEYVQRLQNLGGDVEAQHSDGDKILCELLTKLGYGAVVEEWEKLHRWYS
jgi:hypothetical protein